LQNAGKRIIKSKVLGSPEDPGNPGAVRDENSALEKINENFKSIHPLNQMNDHVKVPPPPPPILPTHANSGMPVIARIMPQLAGA